MAKMHQVIFSCGALTTVPFKLFTDRSSDNLSWLLFINMNIYMSACASFLPDHQLFKAWFLSHLEHVEECFVHGRCWGRCLPSEFRWLLVPILLPPLPGRTWTLTYLASPFVWILSHSHILGFSPSWLFLFWPYFFSFHIAVQKPSWLSLFPCMSSWL